MEQERIAKGKEIEDERIEKARAHELETLKLQLEAQKLSSLSQASPVLTADSPKLELKKLIPNFNVKEDDISLFLYLFERQLKFLKVSENQWVAYLVGVLPSDVAKIIAREPDEKAEDYNFIKNILLKRFKLSAERFRQLFATHKKTPDCTWNDFYFELRSYFENWIKEVNVNTFEKLRKLIITDQIKKKCPPDFKEHFLDDWSEIISPTELAEKLDAYDNLRHKTKREGPVVATKKPFTKAREDYPRFNSAKKQVLVRKFEKPKQEEHSSVYCYNCSTPGFIKLNCTNCRKTEKKISTRFHSIQLNSLSTSSQMAILEVNINGMWGTAYADNAATHTIAGESLYHLLKERATRFEKSNLDSDRR
nr:uncharacterized protein LOC122268725 [Parasteatoda tepidariorum]